MTDQEIKDKFYKPNSMPQATWVAIINGADLETLKRYQKIGGLSIKDSRVLAQAIRSKTPVEPKNTEEPMSGELY